MAAVATHCRMEQAGQLTTAAHLPTTSVVDVVHMGAEALAIDDDGRKLGHCPIVYHPPP